MPKTKKIVLLHERRETWRFRFGKNRSEFCEQCRKKTFWLTGTEAAQISDFSEREIFRLAAAAEIHFRETPSNILLVCARSLEGFCSKRGR